MKIKHSGEKIDFVVYRVKLLYEERTSESKVGTEAEGSG